MILHTGMAKNVFHAHQIPIMTNILRLVYFVLIIWNLT